MNSLLELFVRVDDFCRAFLPAFQGTARALTNSSGTKTDGLETDAFGMVVSVVGTPLGARPFGFAANHGYQSDSDTGLQRLGHRFYDPSTGRFLSRDPIRAGYNWYAYCDNDSVNRVDPEGLEEEPGDRQPPKGDKGKKPPKPEPIKIKLPILQIGDVTLNLVFIVDPGGPGSGPNPNVIGIGWEWTFSGGGKGKDGPKAGIRLERKDGKNSINFDVKLPFE